MKIAHVTYYYNDGMGYQDNVLPRYQQKMGHTVAMITTDLTTPFSRQQSRLGRKQNTGCYFDGNLPILRLPHYAEWEGRFVVFKNLAETLKIEKPDYIFHHGLNSPSLITCTKYKSAHPSVFFIADNHADLNTSARNKLWRIAYYQKLRPLILKPCLKYIDLVFGVTPARCFFAEKIIGIPRNKIRLLPIGADTDTADKTVSSKNKEDNGLRLSELKLVTGGKWTKNKRLDILLKSIEGLNVHLNIFGRIEDPEVQGMISGQENVSFLGWQDRENTLRLLADADLALWPGQHTTLMEDAVATNTPLLLRYHGSTSHHIRGNGAYFFSSNPMEIRQHLEMIIKNPEILIKMKQHTKVQRDLLSYDQVAKDSIDYYYDQEPKTIHRAYMEDPFCNPKNPDFERINL